MIVTHIDWAGILTEYPASIERGGSPVDTPNLTAFFKELREALPNNLEVSLATPGGYWFLKGKYINCVATLNFTE